MKQTILIKLVPNETQFAELKETMESFNKACKFISDIAFKRKIFNNWQLHHLVYRQTREQFKLSSQMTVRAISKVADARARGEHPQGRFSTDHTSRRIFWTCFFVSFRDNLLTLIMEKLNNWHQSNNGYIFV
ncbi:hypothetical protein MUP77_04385 [Candidatus Bathyarchaeota archaeon]|nr:hypothetical protein [Candidatus Bathyarchaeota archaeon]